MSFGHDKLPLDYPTREMFCIYRDRLLLFSGIVMGNLLLLFLVMFALSQPVVFIIALGFVVAFGFVCWWSSRNVSLAEPYEGGEKKDLDLASDAEAIAAIWALLGVSRAIATPHKRIEIRPAGPHALRELLEDAERFQRLVVAEYFQHHAKGCEDQTKEQNWIRLAKMSEKIADRIVVALQNIPEEDLKKDMSHLEVRPGHINALNWWLLAPRFIKDPVELRKMHVAKSTIDELKAIKLYVSFAPAALGMLLHARLTDVTNGEIGDVRNLTQELLSALLEVKHK